MSRGFDPRTTVMEFVSASVWHRKAGVALADGGEFGRQIGQVVGDR
jgi:hypothetical protein